MISFRNNFWFFVFLSITAAIAALTFTSWHIWSGLQPNQKTLILELVSQNVNYIIGIAFLFMVVSGLALDGLLQNFILPFRKIKDETRIIISANPSHRIKIDGQADVRKLAEVINEGAENFQKLKREMEARVREALVDSEGENKVLAAVISQLPHGIFICDTDGQIILFNQTAQDYFKQDEKRFDHTDTNGNGNRYIGLGRFIFDIIDKPIVTHAMGVVVERLDTTDDNPSTSFMVSGRQEKMLRVEVVPILDQVRELNGFMFIVADMTRRVETENKINFLLSQLTIGTRASLASIKSAVEAVIEFKQMDARQRDRFIDIIHAEAHSLSELLNVTDREFPDRVRGQWSLIPMRMYDIIHAVQSRAANVLGLDLTFRPPEKPRWFRGDSFPLIAAVLFILEQMQNTTGCDRFEADIGGIGKLAHLEISWRGAPLDREYIYQWRDESVSFGGESLPVKIGEVLEKHSADLILNPADDDAGKHMLRLVLPTISPRKQGTAANIPTISAGRPEFYDFDLFGSTNKGRSTDKRALEELVYTVFDTETTGLDPRGGDEIISIGAIRIVNQRILQADRFDQLVDPQRDVPWESVKVHGIQPGMLVGQPRITRVLPDFHRFAQDTILVGHNIAFDMAMLEMKQVQTGVVFENAMLDTMLLSTVVHPSHKDHSMEKIAERLGIEITGRHTAVGDAVATAELFIKMIPLLKAMGIQTLGEAINASRKSYYARLKY